MFIDKTSVYAVLQPVSKTFARKHFCLMLLCWLTLNTGNKLGRGNHLVQILFAFYFMFLFEMKFKRLFISEVHPANGAFKGLDISVRSYVPFKVSQMIISFTTDFTVIQIVTQMQAFVLCV